MRWACLALVAWLGACTAQARSDGPSAITISTQPVQLNPQTPGQTQVGAFIYAGGLALTSQGGQRLGGQRLGGLSDMVIDAKGSLSAISDEGELLRAQIITAPDGQLSGLGLGQISPLLGQDGKALPNKFAADAEGLTLWPNGDLMVSFEHDHRIWLYPAAGGAAQPLPMPDVAMPPNDGMEGLSLAPSQGLDAYWVGAEAGRIWLCHIKTVCKAYPNLPMPPQGYRLSGLREGPDGQLFILHHSWNPAQGSRIVLSVVADPAGPAPKPVQTLSLAPPLSTDNFEGIAVTKAASGALRIYLLSDDNFSKTQRTLLMAFDLMPSTGP
jgi:hypothetical protein